jgi:ankyrin repeat protein
MKVVQTLFLLYTLFLLGKSAPLVDSDVGQEVFGEAIEIPPFQPESQDLEVIEPANTDAQDLGSREIPGPYFWDPWFGSGLIAKELLRNGAEVNARDYQGRTALHQAVIGQSKNVVLELLKNGADITARDNEGRTALHLAAATRRLEILKLLLEEGADVNVHDNEGKTPLQLAATDGIEWRLLM